MRRVEVRLLGETSVRKVRENEVCMGIDKRCSMRGAVRKREVEEIRGEVTVWVRVNMSVKMKEIIRVIRGREVAAGEGMWWTGRKCNVIWASEKRGK